VCAKRNRFSRRRTPICSFLTNIEQEGDGFTLLESVRELNPRRVAIFIPAYPPFETAHRAFQQEADGYVNKPADIEELVALIERKLAAGSRPTNVASG
jgi:DNA-binding NtrC family response regulator